MGVPPYQYREKRRHDAACALLMQRSLMIADIAGVLGYCSPHEFSAKFKRRAGSTPSDYRKSITEGDF
jgi:bacterial regulatory helix-turn-helix proteins, araC family